MPIHRIGALAWVAVAVGALSAASSAVAAMLSLASDAFVDGNAIPVEATCDSGDHSPVLRWDAIPVGTKAFALVVHDPDAPGGYFVHWILFNIPGPSTSLDGTLPSTPKLRDGSANGKNDFGKVGYAGPCPPRGEKHRYVFTLYALSERLDLEPGAAIDAVLAAIVPRKLGEARLTGTYTRPIAQSG
jgi:Raf kinase inhibitor-like YbhB/YbcL family protein